MAFTTDLNTDIGQVRLLLTDLDVTKPIYPDDTQIQAFLNMELGDVKQAAALGLETIAGNRAFTMRVVQILDLKTDGRATAQGILEVAKRLRDTSNLDWAGIDFAQVTDDSLFAYREYLWKQVLQQSI